MPGKGKPPIRQSEYTEEMAIEICSQLAAGTPLRQICATKGMPKESTVRGWVIDNPQFAAQYSRARSIGIDCIAEGILAIADECRIGEKTERKEVGRACSKCGMDVRWLSGWKHSLNRTALCENGKAEPVVEEKVVSGDMIERARLQVDARKWLLSKMRPDKYGDRLELAGDQAAPLAVCVEFVKPQEGK